MRVSGIRSLIFCNEIRAVKKKEVERLDFKTVHKNNWYNEGMKGMVTV